MPRAASDYEATAVQAEASEEPAVSRPATGLSDAGIGAVQGLGDTDSLREARLDAATEKLKQVEWLKPERWAQLDPHEKAVALNTAGRELSGVYGHPSPPLLIRDLGDSSALGVYGDGYRFDSDTGKVEGAEYGIEMNKEARVDYERLFGDDPAIALRTYAHEFRHSYQTEQANRYNKPQFQNLVDDTEAAREWSENLRNYIGPNEDYGAYRDQPVERDARGFAEELIKRIYGSRTEG